MKIESYIKNNEIRKRNEDEYKLLRKHIEKIQKIALKVISYPEYKEAYDYVDNIFPGSNVKNVNIYKVAAIELEKMGFGAAEGFYDKISRIIVLCGARKSFFSSRDKRYIVKAKLTTDEVIVHELCHYAYASEGNFSTSRDMHEEFAYGWSLGYLRGKGYSDDYIINYNFLPHLVGICYDEATANILAENNISNSEFNNYTKFKKKEFNRSYGGKIFLRAKELAFRRGERLIKLYSSNIEEGGYSIIEEEKSRFSILDL